MTWGEAFGRSVYYVFAHLVLAILVLGTWAVGAYMLGTNPDAGITELTLTGAVLILVGFVFLILGGPAIWIKVIGDIVASTERRKDEFLDDYGVAQEVQVPVSLLAKSAEELVVLAEELGGPSVFPVRAGCRLTIWTPLTRCRLS